MKLPSICTPSAALKDGNEKGGGGSFISGDDSVGGKRATFLTDVMSLYFLSFFFSLSSVYIYCFPSFFLEGMKSARRAPSRQLCFPSVNAFQTFFFTVSLQILLI